MITRKQKYFFEKLKELYGSYALPSFDKIADDLGYKYKNSVFQYIQKLREENLIYTKNNKFYINPNEFKAKLFSTKIKAGFTSFGDDDIKPTISLDEKFKINSPSTYLFEVSGDSMVDAGIYEGDIVIIQKGFEAKNGDIVLAYIDGGFTLKFFRNNSKGIYLEPANKNYPIFKPKSTLEIFGKVKGIIREIS